jgi:hypothetical protein
VVEAVLGHSRKGIERTYDLRNYEAEYRERLQRWSDHLETDGRGEALIGVLVGLQADQRKNRFEPLVAVLRLRVARLGPKWFALTIKRTFLLGRATRCLRLIGSPNARGISG